MGLFSFLRRQDNYEEILFSLEQDIRKTEKQKANTIDRTEWWARNWRFYTGLVWLGYVGGFVFYEWPNRYAAHSTGFLIHLVSVVILPFLIYYGVVGIRAIGNQSIESHNRKLKRLRNELKDRIDELKKKTAYDSTKTLIDKYSSPGKGQSSSSSNDKAMTTGAAVARLKEQQQQQSMKNRRQTLPNFNSSPALANRGGVSNSMVSPTQQQGNNNSALGVVGGYRSPPVTSMTNIVGSNDQTLSPPSGVVRVNPRSSSLQPSTATANYQRQSSSLSKPWLDKLVDQLVGDSGNANDKYALICRHCYAHNGLVPEEEIHDIQYTCPRCGKFNPSQRKSKEQQDEVKTPIDDDDNDNENKEEEEIIEPVAASDEDNEYEDVDVEERPESPPIARRTRNQQAKNRKSSRNVSKTRNMSK